MQTKYITICCGRAGKIKSKSSNSLKPHSHMEIDFKTLIRLGKSLDGKWKINLAKLEHNHNLSPRYSHCFLVNRELSSSMKRRLELNNVSTIGLNKSFNSTIVEARRYKNVPFFEKNA